MFFNFSEFIFNPFVLIFASIFFGMLFGKLKIKNFHFGAAGPLFAGLLIGYLTLHYAHSVPKTSENYSSAQSFIDKGVIDDVLFTTFLVLFVTSIGLLASNSISKVIKKYGYKFIILGFLITFMGAVTNYALTQSFPSTDKFKVSGAFSGAMTSSPSLASALETVKKNASDDAKNYSNLNKEKKQEILNVLNAHKKGSKLTIENTPKLTKEQQATYVEGATADIGIGHSISFPFGDLVVILSMTFLHRIFKINLEKEKREFAQIMSDGNKKEYGGNQKFKNVLFDVTGFALAALFGLFIGNIEIPFGSSGTFSLGSTGGALIGSLALGSIGKIKFINFRMNDKVLQVLRTICLEFFLSIVGLQFGYGVVDSITSSGIIFVIVALITAGVALLSGFLVGRYIMKMNWVLLSGAICGGMTNTTGMGTLLDVLKSDDAATGYGATYPFALIGMILFTILMHQF